MVDKPALRALVGYFSPAFGLLTIPKLVSLDDAADYAQSGFVVLVDPADERALVMWEGWQRACAPKRK